MRRIINLIGFIILLFGVFSFGFHQNKTQKTTLNPRAITIGSKNFTESKIVMQIYADVLKKNNYQVTTKPNISSSVVYQAAKLKQIDLYPDYTGTIALTYLNKKIVGKNPKQIANVAKTGISKDKLTILNYSPANDAQGLIITTKAAKKYHIKTISDLQKNANKLRFISQGEFDKRQDGLVGLSKIYGQFNFKSHKLYDPSLRYELFDKNQGDVTTASTTEGQLASKKYRILQDNKKFWPSYNLVPVIGTKVLRKYPKIQSILNQVSKKLTTAELTNLNKKVDVDGKSYKTVAKEWVNKNYERK